MWGKRQRGKGQAGGGGRGELTAPSAIRFAGVFAVKNRLMEPALSFFCPAPRARKLAIMPAGPLGFCCLTDPAAPGCSPPLVERAKTVVIIITAKNGLVLGRLGQSLVLQSVVVGSQLAIKMEKKRMSSYPRLHEMRNGRETVAV